MSLSVTNQQIAAALASPAAGGDASLQQAGNHFKMLMRNPLMSPPHHGSDMMSTNVIAKMAAAQDVEIQKSVQEMTAAAMKAALELASTQLDMGPR